MTAFRHARVRSQPRVRLDLHRSEDLRTTALGEIPGQLAALGADPTIVFREAGIDPAALADPSQRLRCDTVAGLLDDCVHATRCEHFGLLVGEKAGTAAIGLIDDLIRNASTVGEALHLLSAHIRLADRGLVIVPQVHDAHRAELALVLCDPAMRGAAPYLDAGLAITLAVMRSLCGPKWRPAMVTLARAAPRDTRPYRVCFGAQVRFGRGRTALLFAASQPDRRLSQPDAAVRRDLLQRVTDLEAALPATATESVIRALSALVTARSPTRADVADAVGLSPRTLCRRLLAEGTNFRELLTEVRCGLAAQMLEESDIPVAEISTTLHFSAPGAFTRSYKAWSGRTPVEQRAAMRTRRRPAPA